MLIVYVIIIIVGVILVIVVIIIIIVVYWLKRCFCFSDSYIRRENLIMFMIWNDLMNVMSEIRNSW